MSTPDPPQPVLREMALRTARLTLHVARAGRGAPLLFLGGSNFDMRLRRAVFESDLPRFFEVITYEPRGLARSDAPPGAWTMRDYADDAASLLDALDIPRAFVLGESFGGMTALHLAGHYPERVVALATMAATAGGASGRSYPIENWLALPVAQAAEAGLRLQDRRFGHLYETDPETARAQIARRTDAEAAFRACPANAAGYPRLLQARAGHDAMGLLASIRCPGIIMAGRHDDQAPVDSVRWLATALPNAEFLEFDGGHGFGFASAEPVGRLLTAWHTGPAQG